MSTKKARGTRSRVRAGTAGDARAAVHAGGAPPRAGAGKASGAVEAVAAVAATGLALGFYVWMLGGPGPMENVELRPSGFDPFAGLPAALGMGIAAAALAILTLSSVAPLRARRSAIVLASAGLYLAAGSPAIGRAALVLAPLVMAAHLAWTEIGKPRALPGPILAVLHVGTFVSACGFFHDWARYAGAWAAFVANLGALRTLLL